MGNKSRANEEGFFYQKQVFMFLALLEEKYKEISYEKTDDIQIKYLDYIEAIEVTIDKGLVITASNKKFLKSLRNYLEQYKGYITSKKVKFKIITTNEKLFAKKGKFNLELIDKMIEKIEKKLKSGNVSKIEKDLLFLLKGLSDEEKDYIVNNFAIIYIGREDIKHLLIDNLSKYPINKIEENWDNILHNVFREYYIGNSRTLIVSGINEKICNIITRDELKYVTVEDMRKNFPKKFNNRLFIEKLKNIELSMKKIEEAKVHYTSYFYYLNRTLYKEWYNLKRDEIDNIILATHLKEYDMASPDKNQEYLTFKFGKIRDQFEKETHKSMRLKDFIEGNVEKLSDEDKIKWE